MNKEEILEMPAGSEVDHLVAVDVMGWKDDPEVPYYDFVQSDEVIHVSKRWSPSTDISAAWEVLEKLNEVKDPENNDGDYGIWVKVWERLSDVNLIAMTGKDVALEICRAALLAVGGGK